MLDYASILQSGQQLVPNLRQQLLQDAVATQRQREFELREQALQQQLRAQEEAQARQAEYRQAMERVLINPTPQAIFELQSRYPDMSKGVVDAFDRLDSNQRERDLTSLGTIFTRAQSGDIEGAAGLIRSRIAADADAGQDTSADQAILDGLLSGNPVERRGAVGVIGMQLAALTPDKFGENFARFNPQADPTPLQREVEYLRSVGRDDLAEQVLRNAGSPDLVAVDAGGSVYRKSDFATGQTEGGDPSGSGATYPEGTVIENPETGEEMIMRDGQFVPIGPNGERRLTEAQYRKAMGL